MIKFEMEFIKYSNVAKRMCVINGGLPSTPVLAGSSPVCKRTGSLIRAFMRHEDQEFHSHMGGGSPEGTYTPPHM